MLAYVYKGKKSLKPGGIYCSNNQFIMFHYYYYPTSYNIEENCYYCIKKCNDIYVRYETENQLTENIYICHETLKQFNNTLAITYDINDNFIIKFSFIKEYLQEHDNIKQSIDEECKKIYTKLENWYHRITSNPNCLNEIKWEVAKIMKHYEKQDIYKVASTNLKRNYYDFVV